MGYEIRYGNPMPGETNNRFAFPVFFAALLLFLAVGIRAFIPGGFSAWIAEAAPKTAQTWQAVQTMARQIEEGEALGDALERFCREVLENAQIINGA